MLDGLRNVLGGRRGVDRLTIDGLRHEQIRLEQLERRVSRETDELEARKHGLFVRGKDEPSSRQRLALARKIKQLDSASRAKGRQLAMFHKHLRIVDGLLQIKENASLLRDLQVSSVISRMSVEELTAHVERASVEGQFEMDKFTSLLGSMDGAIQAAEQAEPDADLAAIVAAMEEARAAEEAGRPEGVARAAQRVENVLAKEDPQPQS
jgi:hypothetical protein